MKWECKKCTHEKVCDEWGKQEGVAACTYGDYFQDKRGSEGDRPLTEEARDEL